jgi:amphi-Trp domain-containing protein
MSGRGRRSSTPLADRLALDHERDSLGTLEVGRRAHPRPAETFELDAECQNRCRPEPEPRNVTTRETRMNLMEITEKQRLSREDAAARLRALADALARNNEVEFERGGLRFTVHVPDEVDFKLEIEIDAEERELEVELKW